MTQAEYNSGFAWTMWAPTYDMEKKEWSGGICYKFRSPSSNGYPGGCPGTYRPSQETIGTGLGSNDDWASHMGNLAPNGGGENPSGYVYEFMPNHKPFEELYCWQDLDTIEERIVYTS